MSGEASPSRQLSESLGQFHISSPSKFKAYAKNNEFKDAEFDSQLKPTDTKKSYIEKLGNWSVNYATVQHRETDDENRSPPQWKQYMELQSAQKAPQETQSHADLIVTSSLSDISLIPTNTFKNRGQRPHLEESDDPAREALGVFDNVLRHQRSTYLNGTEPSAADAVNRHGENSNKEFNDDEYETTSNSSYDSINDTMSSPSLRQAQKTNPIPSSSSEAQPSEPRQGLKLITPEDAGMVFNYKEGVWDQPSTNVDASTSGAQTSTLENDDNSSSKIVSFKLPRVRAQEASGVAEASLDASVDDTPLSTPKVDSKFLMRPRAMKASTKAAAQTGADTTINLMDNVTNVSELDTSYRLTKGAVMSALVDAIPRKESWDHVISVDLSDRTLESLVGMDRLVPALQVLDVSHNRLNSLQGAPQRLLALRCAHNKLAAYCNLDELPHLETVDLSHNALSTNLSLLSGCLHLRRADMSHNAITSLRGLGRAALDTLRVARNRVIGALDFADLVSDDSSSWMQLRELDLSGNKITSLKNLHLLRELRVLRLDGNPLETLQGNSSSSLRTLTLRNCTALRELGDFPRLRVLRMHGGSFAAHALPELLEELELTGYRSQDAADTGPGSNRTLTNPSPETTLLPGLLPPFLRKLELVAGAHRELPERLQIRCPGLHTLVVRDNQLTSAHALLERLPINLRVLDLRGNPLVQFANDAERDRFLRMVSLALPTLSRMLV
ncbi:LAFE_0D12728g1_1 [Lachancea fermentati]|uniref:LAFE_0D12728g1_1 n=1 Tax=Lachancea fermentati TaxID=4955 RepID=A0A1G4MC75_LACFM|nr:LAFE_0D12728g1_1 [Lachancea fermentati]